MSNIWDQYGGKDAYITSQQKRYGDATMAGDQDLINRLQADAQRVGYTLSSPQASTQSNATTSIQPVAQQANSLSGQQQSQFPYEQALQQLLTSGPQYSQSPGEMQAQAQQYAGLQIDPQITRLQQLQDRQAQTDLESAIARGAGRSGVVDWQSDQRNKYYGDQFTDLEARRGDLAAQHMAGLQTQQHERGVDDWNRQQQAALALSQMAQQHSQAEWGRSLDMHDRTMLTPLQQLQLHLGYTEALGQTPDFMINQYGGTQSNTATNSAAIPGGMTAAQYRQEIERKLKAGIKFDNEAAARAFAPGLFRQYGK